MSKLKFEDVTIRNPNLEDIEPLAFYFYDCPHSKHVHDHLNYDYMPSKDGFLEKYADVVKSGEKSTFLTVEVKGKPIGIHSLTHIENNTGHMHAHFWDVEMRGKGIANFSGVKALEVFFKRFDLEKIYLCPPVDNPMSSRFMEKIGLEKIDTKEYESPVLIPGIIVDIYEITPQALKEFKNKSGFD